MLRQAVSDPRHAGRRSEHNPWGGSEPMTAALPYPTLAETSHRGVAVQRVGRNWLILVSPDVEDDVLPGVIDSLICPVQRPMWGLTARDEMSPEIGEHAGWAAWELSHLI